MINLPHVTNPKLRDDSLAGRALAGSLDICSKPKERGTVRLWQTADHSLVVLAEERGAVHHYEHIHGNSMSSSVTRVSL